MCSPMPLLYSRLRRCERAQTLLPRALGVEMAPVALALAQLNFFFVRLQQSLPRCAAHQALAIAAERVPLPVTIATAVVQSGSAMHRRLHALVAVPVVREPVLFAARLPAG